MPRVTSNASIEEFFKIKEVSKPTRGFTGFFRALFGLAAFSALAGLILFGMMVPGFLVAAGTTEGVADWWEDLPHEVIRAPMAERTVVMDSQGNIIFQYFKEDRVIVDLENVSENVVNALIATEDSRFYEHGGVDTRGILRAVVNNLTSDSKEGASTLTQQLVENLRVNAAQGDVEEIGKARTSTIYEKIEETRIATELESTMSKDEILENYLNIVYFGNRSYGIEAAAQRYFSKTSKDLSINEAALLIGLVKGPNDYDPVTNPEKALDRRNTVLSRMHAEDYISTEEFESLRQQPIELNMTVPANGCDNSPYPFYCQLVIDKFLDSPEFGDTVDARREMWELGGLLIHTPMDPETMNEAQQVVDNALGRGNRVAAGVAMIQPGTGHVLAIAQNRSWGTPTGPEDFEKTQIVYANTPNFQPGSSFKPITAAAALEFGYTPGHKINSVNRASYPNLDEPPGGFKNSNHRDMGMIDMGAALKFSVNTYFTGLVSQIGVVNTADFARRIGLKSTPTDLTGREGSLTLGAYETSPLEVASAYATFAGRGVACDPLVFTSITKISTGEAVRTPDGNCRQEISPAIADTIAHLMTGAFEGGGTASGRGLSGGRPAAGKTGTTQNSSAAWFAGFTPQVATAVWLGDPRGGFQYPLRGVWAYGRSYGTVYGGTIPAPMWKEIMDSFHEGLEHKWFPAPGGVSASITSRRVPNLSGVDIDAAVTILLNEGFRVNIEEVEYPPANTVSGDHVFGQSPEGGGTAVYGDIITLRILKQEKDLLIPEFPEDLQEE